MDVSRAEANAGGFVPALAIEEWAGWWRTLLSEHREMFLISRFHAGDKIRLSSDFGLRARRTGKTRPLNFRRSLLSAATGSMLYL